MDLVLGGPYEPAAAVALDEVLLESVKRGQREELVRIWINGPSAVIGYSLSPCEEVRCEEARRLGIPVVKRASGGGAVYHDFGNINVSVIRLSESTPMIDEIYEEITSIIIESLRELGLFAHVENKNDVVVGEHKVSGSAAAVRGRAYLAHATLLVSTNMEVLKRIIIPRLDRVERGEVTRAKYNPANLRDIAGVSLSQAMGALYGALERRYGSLSPSSLEHRELELSRIRGLESRLV